MKIIIIRYNNSNDDKNNKNGNTTNARLDSTEDKAEWEEKAKVAKAEYDEVYKTWLAEGGAEAIKQQVGLIYLQSFYLCVYNFVNLING